VAAALLAERHPQRTIPFYTRLLGLKVMLGAGLIHDPRCQPALDFVEEA